MNDLKAHFNDGAAAAFSPKEGSHSYILQVVANKYNPTNYWYVMFLSDDFVLMLYYTCRSGRWRSEYASDLTNNLVSGKIFVNIHYYEQGNVGITCMWWRANPDIGSRFS